MAGEDEGGMAEEDEYAEAGDRGDWQVDSQGDEYATEANQADQELAGGGEQEEQEEQEHILPEIPYAQTYFAPEIYLSTQPTTVRFFARVRAFDLACPRCGTLYKIGIGSKTQRCWSDRLMRFDCFKCHWRAIIGIVAWPVPKGKRMNKFGLNVPIDATPNVREAQELRHALGSGLWMGDGLESGRDRAEPGAPVNRLVGQPDDPNAIPIRVQLPKRRRGVRVAGAEGRNKSNVSKKNARTKGRGW